MKRITIILIPLILFFIIRVNTSSQVQEKEKNIDEIITELKRESTDNPSDINLYFLLGDAYVKKGLLDAAYEEYNKVFRINNENTKSLMKIGSIQLRRQNWEDAEEKFRSALDINSKSIGPTIEQGLEYEYSFKYDSSIVLYEKAIEIYSDLIEINKNLGMISGRKGMYEEGTKYYQESLEYKKILSETYCTLGILYRKRNLINASIMSFKNALEITPQDKSIYYNLGLTYLLVDSLLDESATALNNSIKIDSTDAEVHYNLGIIYGRLGNLGGEIWELQKAVEIKPDYVQARIDLARSYYNNKQYLSAWDEVKEIEKNSKVVPDRLIFLLTKAIPRPKD